jgi:hypothetical protein
MSTTSKPEVKLNEAKKEFMEKKTNSWLTQPHTFTQTAEVHTRDKNNTNRKIGRGPGNTRHTKMLAGGRRRLSSGAGVGDDVPCRMEIAGGAFRRRWHLD